ncbi:MAG TPA: aldo/keto reductase [Thermoanaerobaculia bacterium]|nr:aldo/keto reductase [Thermoanaerobaculia bacterium]
MIHSDRLTRREMLRLTTGFTAALVLGAAACGRDGSAGEAAAPRQEGTSKMQTRPIPSSGEALPVIGLGTYINFDVEPGSEDYKALPAVLGALFASGGTVIDSSPMYGRAERTTGELLATRNPMVKPFLATKVWTSGREAGIAQMEESFRLLKTDRIDLMQIHNLVDWRTHLPTLRKWKEQGRIRYVGITHYTPSAYASVESALKAEPFDFLQINYAIDDRDAEERLLPLARERKVAVICNRPFGGGDLLRRMRGKPLPGWTAEVGATSWAQLALKFLLANPAVTCAIPGTGNPRYMAENAAAGSGPALTEAQRRELIAAVG